MRNLTSTRVCGIKPGDSKPLVRELLGEATKIETLGHLEEWTWEGHESVPHYIRFANDRVIEINGGVLSVDDRVLDQNCSKAELLKLFPSLQPDVKLSICETFLTAIPGLELRMVIFLKGGNKYILRLKPGRG